MSPTPLQFDIQMNPSALGEEQRTALLRDPGFGKIFTDHMVTITYNDERGWHDARIEPHRGFDMDPATMVLQYALLVFEGMKAYRQPDGGAALFRPEANAKRLADSARRLAMEPLPEEMFLQAVREFVKLERHWIPDGEGASLYLRPFLMCNEIALGTRPSREFKFCIIGSPVGPYFKGGAKPLKLWVSDNFIRAAPGGMGAAKCAGNYAASLAAQLEGQLEGCEQAIFLDAIERRWIEELGGMNVFFVFQDGSLQTPPLGTILPGITRDSLIKLARSLGHEVREELYSIDQWQEDAKSGRLVEAFACGTAAVITPIGEVKGRRHAFTIGGNAVGPVATKLRKELTDIQFGRAADPQDWLDRLF